MLTLRHRVLLLCLSALLLAGLAIACAAWWREAQWQQRLDQAAQLPLRQAWDGVDRQWRRALADALDKVQAAGALPDDAIGLHKRLAAAVPVDAGWVLEVYDARQQRLAPSDGQSVGKPSLAPLLDGVALAALAGGPRADQAGLRLRDLASEGQGGPVLAVLARPLDDGRVLAIGADLRPWLRQLETALGSTVGLMSPRGLLLAGVPAPSTQAVQLALPAIGAPPSRPAAWLRGARPTPVSAPAIGWTPWLLLAAVGGVFVAALALGMRHLIAPLLRPAALLEALAEGQLQARADDSDLPGSPEAARLARAAERLRAELRALDALRDERQRVGAQQARLMRRQMRQLAGMLDAAGRQEIMGQLGDEGTQGIGDDGQPQLVRLASLLGRLTALVGRQHARVLELLRELQDSVATREKFASLQQELAIARQIQQAILPRGAPPLPQVSIDATMIPAREVGGDFYDWFALDEHRLALAVADVSGKGVPAAFFMAVTRTLMRSTVAFVDDLADAIARLNNGLAQDNEQTMFVTLFYAVLDTRSGVLDYVNAGHNPPLLRRADGSVQWLARGRNPALGAFEGLAFRADQVRLAPGDGLLLYTDGVTEAQTADGQLFGEDALVQALQADGPSPVPGVVAAVRAFEAGAPQADDITCVWVQRG